MNCSATRKPIMLVVLAFALSSWLCATEKTITVEGKLVSASCYLPDKSAGTTGDSMSGGEHCGSGCLEQGKPGGLLTNDHAFYILDAPSLRLAPFVGQQIRVTGQVEGTDILSAKTVDVRKGDAWQSIDIKFHPGK
jgi:hypothetical protein